MDYQNIVEMLFRHMEWRARTLHTKSLSDLDAPHDNTMRDQMFEELDPLKDTQAHVILRALRQFDILPLYDYLVFLSNDDRLKEHKQLFAACVVLADYRIPLSVAMQMSGNKYIDVTNPAYLLSSAVSHTIKTREYSL